MCVVTPDVTLATSHPSVPFSQRFETQSLGHSRSLAIREATASDAETWARSWLPLLSNTRADDLNWDWAREIDRSEHEDGFVCFAVVSDAGPEGLMSLSISTSRLAPPNGIVYIEYLAAAPWNRKDLQASRYAGIGTLLIEAAFRVSFAVGLSGRIGLHSKRQAESFYRDKLGLVDLGPEMTEDGEWVYFEATPEVARKKLS